MGFVCGRIWWIPLSGQALGTREHALCLTHPNMVPCLWHKRQNIPQTVAAQLQHHHSYLQAVGSLGPREVLVPQYHLKMIIKGM